MIGEVKSCLINAEVFPDFLDVRILPSGRRVELLHEFRIWLPERPSVTVPQGFTTDFASVPRMFWRVLPPWGLYSSAAVGHDYLYRMALLSRDVCDEMFREMMLACGVCAATARTMYLAVRLGGASSYNKEIGK